MQVKRYAKSNPIGKDNVIEQLKARVKDQSAMIELLKQQLSVKDEQIASANRLADQVTYFF
ncbi:hypothetical protein [Limosilactobacillus fermentum]|uniref:hypothetical protein n=1 Tax=Limosilactobacillus fermentum TaxID=1613 RepID=UPI00293198C7|nr:hypothetical protein [Limosilactobacillus fermentum]WNY95793.1 hypothetical protein PE049_05900 [Limosilactobacillus fermentum]